MSKQGYPESLNCWLSGYPRFIKVTFGFEMGNLNGPWSNGSYVLLERISFDLPDTSPSNGIICPDVKVNYSDSYSSDWTFKMYMYGWGTFFAVAEDPNYYVDLEKWLEFEARYYDDYEGEWVNFQERFRLRQVVGTNISKTFIIPNVVVPQKIIYEDPSDPPPIDPNINYEDYWSGPAVSLINYYPLIFNINSIDSVSVTSHITSYTGVVGRQIGPGVACAGTPCAFYLFGGQLFVVLSKITYECEDFILGEPLDCSYSTSIAAIYIWDTLIVNGINRLPDLINRA